MAFENWDKTPLNQWLHDGILTWLAIVGCIFLVAWVVGQFAATIRAAFSLRPEFQKLYKTQSFSTAFINYLGIVLTKGFMGPALAVWHFIRDWIFLSPRRVMALATLSFREALRRRVVVIFVIFVIIMLFAGWFLDTSSHAPARLYLEFVLGTTGFLVLLLALFLSSTSLPEDIKNRTIYTVVTKPVRTSELILGRVIGFAMIGTLFLGLLWAISYGFVVRGLDHGHVIEAKDEDPFTRKLGVQLTSENVPPGPIELRTDRAQNHRHTYRVDLSEPVLRTIGADGTVESTRVPFEQIRSWWQGKNDKLAGFETLSFNLGRTDTVQNHWHDMVLRLTRPETEGGQGDIEIVEADDDDTTVVRADADLEFESPEGRLVARVPIWGTLRFTDPTGKPVEKGVSVGDEWTYRSFVQGRTEASGIWTFEGIDEADFPKDKFPRGIPVEMSFEVFRTYKGDTSDPDNIPGIPAQMSIRRIVTDSEGAEITDKWVEVSVFAAREFTTDVRYIPREIESDGEKLDLFKDFVRDGELELRLRCIQPAQYFGFAERDVYLHAGNASFSINMFKAFGGIWLMMVVIIAIGVMFSTFLSSPIAILATSGTIVLGLFADFLGKLATHDLYGGGPMEASLRLVNQDNLISELEPGLTATVVQEGDKIIEGFLRVVSTLLPDLSRFGFSKNVAHGFDISGDGIVIKTVLYALAFVVPAIFVGYLFLKNREVAR